MSRNETYINLSQSNEYYYLSTIQEGYEDYLNLDRSITISIDSSNKISRKKSEISDLYLSQNEHEKIFINFDDNIDEEALSEILDEIEENRQINKKERKTRNNKKKSSSVFKRKRSLHPSQKNKKEKFRSNISFDKRLKEIKSANTISELNFCYKELDDIISKYPFFEIAQIILKINNDINDEDNNNKELYEKIKKITSIIKDKNNITLMCLSILSSKSLLNDHINQIEEGFIEINDIEEIEKEKNEEDIKIEIEKKDNDVTKAKAERKGKNMEKEINENNFFKGFKFKKNKYLFGKHFYKYKGNIYCYVPKTIKPSRFVSVYCLHRYQGCKAKIIVYRNSDYVSVIGTHKHRSRSSIEFYKKYPFLKNVEWKHIQIIKEGGKELVVLQK